LNYLLATSCFLWNQNPSIVAGNGSLGNSTSQLNEPWDFSIDSKFNLYVSDGNNNRIIKFSSGSLIGIPLTSGVGNGLSQVSNPSASFIDIYGNLYVSDMFNHRVMKYTNISLASASLPIIGQIVAGGSSGSNYNQIIISWGVAVDVNGNVFVSDYGNNRVMKWGPGSVTGTLVAGIGNGTAGNGSSQLSCPLGIYLDQNSVLYIADACNGRIQKWLSGSSTGTPVGQIGYPTDVSVDTYGTVYALSGGGLYRFYPGSTLGTLVVGNYQYGYGFKFDSIGNVYLADFGANEIKKYNLTNVGCGE
jgi:sugar lactone lactonase YvrE